MGLLAVIHARIRSLTHARAVIERHSDLSHDDAIWIKDKVWEMILDQLVGVMPGKERDALFSPEAVEQGKEGVRKLVKEMMSGESGENSKGLDID